MAQISQPNRTNPQGFAPAAMLIITCAILSYALLLPLLSFYWDDWPLIWLVETETIGAIGPYANFDRPSHTPIYQLGFLLFGIDPLGWGVMGLVLRIAGGLVLLLGLRRLWPDWTLGTTMIALIFVIYPGFSQQSNALIYMPHFVALLLLALSFTAMIYAVLATQRNTAIVLTIVGALSAFGYYFLLEFFLGIEALRLFLLWHISQQEGRKPVQRLMIVARQFWLYAVMMGIFLVWRVFFFVSDRSHTDIDTVLGDYQSPLQMLTEASIESVFHSLLGSILIWFAPSQYDPLVNVPIFLIIALILALIAYIVVVRYGKALSAQEAPRGLLAWAALSLPFAMFVTTWAGRGIRVSTPGDRYTLPIILGSAIVVTCLIMLMLNPKFRLRTLALLVAASVFVNFSNASVYVGSGLNMRQAMWQLKWRAPDVEEGTTFIYEYDVRPYVTLNYAVWPNVNLAYWDDRIRFSANAMTDLSETPRLLSNAIEQTTYRRTILITEDYRQVIAFAWPSSGACLRILDPQRVEFPAGMDEVMLGAIPYSNPDLIINAEPNRWPAHPILGNEPARGWCYYFQKADLARQFGDDVEVIRLLSEVQDRNLSPGDASEWFPFIESLIRTGDYDSARTLADEAILMDGWMDVELCRMFTRLEDNTLNDICPE